jgi:hypothetical protein
MATRHTAPGDPLWRAAALAFQQCMTAGLPATNIAYVGQAPPAGIWEALAIAFESFFLAQVLMPFQPRTLTTILPKLISPECS